MVHVFDNAVYEIGQLVLARKLRQVRRKVASILETQQGMLDVARNRRVNVLASRFVVSKRRIVRNLSEFKRPGPERAPKTDIGVDVRSPQQPTVLLIWYVRSVDKICAIVELVLFAKPETQGIGSRKDDLHPHRRVDIGKNRRAVDEILHQRHLVDEDIAEPTPIKAIKIAA